jgi:anaerobic magnesium-protoporphyrin IX monomethyl ester cyclase
METASELHSNRPPFKVALVGRRLVDNENLGLAYLVAALDEAGIASARFVLNDASDVGGVADALRRGDFHVVGLSIPDGGSAYLPLAFGELLTRRGFRGHVTCGGSFATLARHFLLQRYRWLDSVVRFAGEVPLVQLIEALREGMDPSTVAGLTTRAGDGGPAPVLHDKPMTLWPARADLPEVLGYPAAHIMATRGCAGRCGYCAPAALQMLEQGEGLRAGLAVERLREAGIGRVRRRAVDDLCDEMSHLWHDLGVRYFYFVDEHLLPYGEDEALAFLHAMKKSLQRRNVGRFGMGTMLRADRLTKRIVEAFADVGLVRAFIGIELASDGEGRRYGRPFDPAHAREVLRACEEAGVVPISHLMMIHPYATRRTIADAIRFMEGAPGGVFEVTEMRVYHGTMLWERMKKERRLVGNPLRYAYTLPDPVVSSFASIFMRLRAEAFWNHSLAYRTHDVFLANALAHRLRPQLAPAAVPQAMDELRRQVVELYVASYRKALGLAEAGASAADAAGMIVEARSQSLALQAKLEAQVEGLAHRLHTSPRIFSPSQAAAAGAIAFTFAGGLAACSNQEKTVGGVGDASRDGKDDAPTFFIAKPNLADGGIACTESMKQEELAQHRRAAVTAASCFSGEIVVSATDVSVRADGLPSATSNNWAALCSSTGDGGTAGEPRQRQWEAAVKQSIAGLDHACLLPVPSADGMAWPTEVSISGAADDEVTTLWAALEKCEGKRNPAPALEIVVDQTGQVAGVQNLPSEIASCLMAALEGLTFPCLAGSTICQEEAVIIE